MAHEAFDPEPISELPPDEPRTPLWMPALGIGLFVVVGGWWTLGGDETEPDTPPTPTATAAAAATPAPRPPAAPPAARPQVDTAKLAELKKRMEEMRKDGKLPRVRPKAPQGGPKADGSR